MATLLAAVLYNILAFHLTLEAGIAPALVACFLWALVFFQYRGNFNGTSKQIRQPDHKLAEVPGSKTS